MASTRILLLPNTNTLSHLGQALAIAEWLEDLGVECHIGLAKARQVWAERFFHRCHGIEELWEHSGVPFPSLGWFSNPDRVERCLRSQEQLRQQLQPALVIGIFDFLCKTSARGLPLVSINGFCMLPVYEGVLGFDESDRPERRRQVQILDRFWRFAARAINPSLEKRGLAPVVKATDMLVGDINLICEIPEVCDAPALPAGYDWIGPIFWNGWDNVGVSPPRETGSSRPTILLNSGSLPLPDGAFLQRLIERLLSLGACVWVNSGEGGISETTDRVFCRPFLSPHETMQRVDLVVCRGGVGTCYQNLCHAVPSLVLPTQPEQATNGIQLQKHGCGRVVAPPLVFSGGVREYPAAIDDQTVTMTLREMLSGLDAYRPHLQRVARALRKYDAQSFLRKLVGDLL
jgi:hypothetical protein